MTIKSKTVSYGLVEIRQNGASYQIYVNGELKEQSSDLNYIMGVFDRKYY